jgi:DNA replication regulator DPB11
MSISGIEMNERTVIGQAIEENGGRYTMDMERGICTHLITDKTNGDKYKFALQWGEIHLVTSRWLRKCLERVS